jgi:hypothetical protein
MAGKFFVVICECAKCGFAPLIMLRPYEHLMHCTNPQCEDYGVIYARPTVDVEPGRAYKPHGR